MPFPSSDPGSSNRLHPPFFSFYSQYVSPNSLPPAHPSRPRVILLLLAFLDRDPVSSLSYALFVCPWNNHKRHYYSFYYSTVLNVDLSHSTSLFFKGSQSSQQATHKWQINGSPSVASVAVAIVVVVECSRNIKQTRVMSSTVLCLRSFPLLGPFSLLFLSILSWTIFGYVYG